MSPSKLERARRHRSEVCERNHRVAWEAKLATEARLRASDALHGPFMRIVAMRRASDPDVHPARARRAYNGPAKSYIHPANAPWSPHTLDGYEAALVWLDRQLSEFVRPRPWDRSWLASWLRGWQDTLLRARRRVVRKLALLRPDLYVGPQWRDV